MLSYDRSANLSGMLFAFAISRPAAAPESDAGLLTRVAARDARAFEALYDRHSRAVYGVLLRMVRERDVADELAQDVFLRLWRKADAFDPERGELLPWLLTVARHVALDRLRSKAEKQRNVEDGGDDAPVAPIAARGEAWVDQRRLSDKARGLMEGLPDGQRRALELAYFEGLSHSEIAAKLDAPLGTVKSWVRKALLRLREQMGGAQ